MGGLEHRGLVHAVAGHRGDFAAGLQGLDDAQFLLRGDVGAHAHRLHEAIRLLFENRQQPDFQEPPDLDHGRIEQRSIWTSTRLNDYLDFPGVGQVFLIERHVIEKKTGKTSTEMAFGLTSHTPQTASAARVLAYNRGHWTIENGCH